MIRTLPRVYWLGVAAVIAVLGIGLFFALRPRSGQHANGSERPTSAGNGSGGGAAVRVSTLHPKSDPSFAISMQQIAGVHSYFEVGLKARVAGLVKYIKGDIGDTVKKGDLLVEIDVPDLDKDVLQKQAIVEQRKQELKLAEAKVTSAQAAVDVAQSSVAQQRAGVTQSLALRDYRKKRLDRFQELLKRQAINDDLVDEQIKDWQAGEGALEMAKASVDKAEADVKEKRANLDSARVEVELKRALVQVAQHDLERAEALAGYSKITAPFDGVITRRTAAPGKFVQNSSTALTEALLSLARIDIVTVVAKVPDNAAPFISRDTPVEVQIDQLPGAVVQAKVTRFSPSIENTDRTMHVEIDLLNSKTYANSDLRSGTAEGCAACVFGEHKILPGMNGYVRFKLRDFGATHLLPSNAVFNRGGKQYVIVVENQKAHFVPVRVQVNDGKLAKVAMFRADAAGRESLVELTGNEEIVGSRQGELDEGQLVTSVLKEW
jgi:multidrug resistance efflux pump